MASGLVCRANRPNTWLHRPACKREETPCQLGAVHTWHLLGWASARIFSDRAEIALLNGGAQLNDADCCRIVTAQAP
jgi:hypothetical protein